MTIQSSLRPDPIEALIQLQDGSMFAPLAPSVEGLTLDNVARGLSNVCRFGGQVRPFYAVAQHSVLVALLAPDDAAAQRFSIFHDGEESIFFGDMQSPMKPFFPDFVQAQSRFGEKVLEAFGIDGRMKRVVKPFDTLALSVERRDLKVCQPHYLAELPPPPDGIAIDALPPEAAYEVYMAAARRVLGIGEPAGPIDAAFLRGRPGFRIED